MTNITTGVTLTEIERRGLLSPCNLADGHAYQNLRPTQVDIVSALPEIWRESVLRSQPEAEGEFRRLFSVLSGSPSLAEYPYARICPTASNSIDLIAAYLRNRRMRTALVEPTFDNLALIMRRRGVDLHSIDERDLFGQRGLADLVGFDALFLVNPNNPTGRELSCEQFEAIVQHCRQHGLLLLLDNSFRFFVEQRLDQYRVLIDSNVSFIALEDTGKVWPTQDLKASLLIASEDVWTEFSEIYEEIYLCVSNFQLALIGAFFSDAVDHGLHDVVRLPVAERRQQFRAVIDGSSLEIAEEAVDSNISVEWVSIGQRWPTDLDALDELSNNGLTVLPGRYFYWNSVPDSRTTSRLRFSLLKDADQFERALDILSVLVGRRTSTSTTTWTMTPASRSDHVR